MTDEGATVEELWQEFALAIETNSKRYIPHKTCKSKDNLPWVTQQIRSMIKRKNRIGLHRKKKFTPIKSPRYQAITDEVKDLNKTIQWEMRRAYWNYVEDLITPTTEGNEYLGMKRFWTFVKHQRKDVNGVAPLNHNGQTATEAKEKADVLNAQFESVFSRETPFPEDIMGHTLPYPPMEDIEFTVAGIEKLLKKLQEHKAPGPDKIAPRILKQLSSTIAPTLAVIFRKSYDTGEVPNEWRKANVVPVFKKGSKHDPGNYRPISLTSIACKTMEHIITSQIMRHGNRNNISHQHQHGFRDSRSCETQLIEFTSDLMNNLEAGNQTDVIILDFSKAFDKVGHARLLHKLQHYGVAGKTKGWIANFLANHTQKVVIDGETSYEGSVLSGVPQGSVLGPSLFLYYINDLPTGLTSEVRLFADDTITYLTLSNQEDATLLQEYLARLEQWEKKWMMEFHPNKCQVMSVSRKPQPDVHKYTLHGITLEHTKAAKYLGVTITQDMRWNTHINNITTKASRSLSFVRRNLQIRNQELKTRTYQALVRPLVEYASTVWDPHTQSNIRKVEMIQRTAARYVTNCWRYNASVTEMLDTLKWTSLAERRRQKRLHMMYRIHNKQVAVNERHQYARPITKTVRGAHPHTYLEPHYHAEYLRNSFFPRTIREWNALPETTASAPSLETFKTRVAPSSP